jgi:signal transduction histidine kinase
MIDGGIERVFRFVEDMVSVAERGAEPPELFDIAPAVSDAIAAVASDLGQPVIFAPMERLPAVTGSRSRFMLAIVNLLRNAAQSRKDAAVRIRIEANVDEVGGELILTVEDDGPGVPEEYRVVIFERGFTLRSDGTGQGLALVREVVETEMRGRAMCEGGPTGGARFVLRLPVSGRKSG